jgi:hypothetical protein
MQILLYLLEMIYMARCAKVGRSDKFNLASICTSGKYRGHTWIIFTYYYLYFFLYSTHGLKYMMNVSQV